MKGNNVCCPYQVRKSTLTVDSKLKYCHQIQPLNLFIALNNIKTDLYSHTT